MASIIPGYNYDIFISYRQKDNKGDQWISEFVGALKTELESTFKEEISVYFDINPHDGLLETHDVDESLKEKLRCLIFIPIISRTYCDPKSFAWEHEFKAFMKEASSDDLGLKIKLPNGNVASRVLPVQIHELDNEDISMCETILGSVLRGIEFIYKSAGVNRPLRATEDHPQDNINKTYYRDQINKVANAIKEIITAIKRPGQRTEEVLQEASSQQSTTLKNRKTKIFAGSIAVLALIILGIVLMPKLINPSQKLEKSIAVLPFENWESDPEYIYLGDAITDEIILQLQYIKDFDRVLSRTSTLQYKDNLKPIPIIAKELGVNYIIEGTIQRKKEKVSIHVQVIRGKNEDHIWAEEFNGEWKDIFTIQDDIALQIAHKLKAVLSPDEIKLIEKKPTKNATAYNLLLKARSSYGPERLKFLDEALNYDSTFADVYAEKGAWWLWYAGGWKGSYDSEEVLANALPLITKALGIDPDNAEAHYGLAGLQIWYFWNFQAAEEEYKTAIQLNPQNAEIIHDYTDLLDASGRFKEALDWSCKGVDADPTTIWEKGLRQYFLKQYEEAIKTYEESVILAADPSRYTEEARVRLYLGHYQKVISILNQYFKDFPGDHAPRALGTLAIAYLKTGNSDSTQILLNQIKQRSKNSPAGSPNFYIAMVYAQMNEKDLAFSYLDKAYESHEIEMYWLKVEPPFEPLRTDLRWAILLKKIGFPD